MVNVVDHENVRQPYFVQMASDEPLDRGPRDGGGRVFAGCRHTAFTPRNRGREVRGKHLPIDVAGTKRIPSCTAESAGEFGGGSGLPRSCTSHDEGCRESRGRIS